MKAKGRIRKIVKKKSPLAETATPEKRPGVDFWRSYAGEEIAEMQGVKPIKDIRTCCTKIETNRIEYDSARVVIKIELSSCWQLHRRRHL
jgi:hypothetical protein